MEDQIESLKANINYLHENIQECQQNILQMEQAAGIPVLWMSSGKKFEITFYQVIDIYWKLPVIIVKMLLNSEIFPLLWLPKMYLVPLVEFFLCFFGSVMHCLNEG